MSKKNGVRKDDKLQRQLCDLEKRLNALLNIAVQNKQKDLVEKILWLLSGLRPIKKVLNSAERRLIDMEKHALQKQNNQGKQNVPKSNEYEFKSCS